MDIKRIEEYMREHNGETPEGITHMITTSDRYGRYKWSEYKDTATNLKFLYNNKTGRIFPEYWINYAFTNGIAKGFIIINRTDDENESATPVPPGGPVGDNIIDLDTNELVFDTWYEGIEADTIDDMFIVTRKGDCLKNVVRHGQKEPLLDTWYMEIWNKWYGGIGVKRPQDERWNIVLKSTGKLVWDGEWFSTLPPKKEIKNAWVVKNDDGKTNILKPDGTLVLDDWIDTIETPMYGSVPVKINGLYDLMNLNTFKIRKVGAYNMIPYKNGKFEIMNKEGKHNFVKATTGEVMSKIWFDSYNKYLDYCGYTRFKAGGKENLLHKDTLEPLFNEWFDEISLLSRTFERLRVGAAGLMGRGDDIFIFITVSNGIMREWSLKTGKKTRVFPKRGDNFIWFSKPDKGGVRVVKTPDGEIKDAE